MPRHIPVYRPILLHALKTAWHHRELWPIAAIAGVAGTGAVVNDLLRQAKVATTIPALMTWIDTQRAYVLESLESQILISTPAQAVIMSLLLIVGVVAVVLLVVACQQVLLRVTHRAATKKRHLHFGELKKELWHPRLLRFLTLDLLLKVLVSNIMLGSALLISFLNTSNVIADAVFGTIFSALAISVALTLNVVIMLSLVGVARADATVSDAITFAWRLYRANPLICLEMSALLFAVNFVISAAFDGIIVLLGVPAVLAFAAVVSGGSFASFVILTTIVVLVVVFLTVAAAGFATTFTYAAWTALAEYLAKRKIVPRMVAHSQRALSSILSRA